MNKLLLTSVVMAAALAVNSLAFSAPVSANAKPWYIGAGANYNAIQTDEHFFPGFFSFSHDHLLKLHDHAWGYNFFVGQHLDGRFAHELGLNLIGDSTWKTVPSSSSSNYADYKIHDIYHIYYDGYIIKPITKYLSVFAKGGLSYLTAKNQGSFSESGDLADDTVREHQNHLLRTFGLNYGVGVQFDWRQFGFRAQYTRMSPSQDISDWYGITDLVNLEILWNLK